MVRTGAGRWEDLYKVPIVRTKDRGEMPLGLWLWVVYVDCLWEPHLSVQPEGSNEPTLMSISISLYQARALKSMDHINLTRPNCFPLLTWLVIMPFSLL